MSSTANGDALISTGDAARMLGVTAKTVREWIEEGRLSAYRFHRVMRIEVAEVERFKKQSLEVRR